MLFYTAYANGQDMHFSQFMENPALINPALTGVNGLRASISHRNQWNSVSMPYKTYGFSAEMRSSTTKKKAPGNTENTPQTEKIPGKFAAGLSIYRDRMGDGSLILTQPNLSLATFLKTGEKGTFSFGIQASYAMRRYDNTTFIFPNQYSGTGYDPDFASGENFAGDKFKYLDLASGFLYSYNSENRGLKDHQEMKAHFGVSAYHLTAPKQKYLAKKTDALFRKYVSHGDLLVSIPNSRTAVSGAYLFQLQGKAIEVTVGGMFRYYMKNDTRYTGYIKRNTVAAGIYYRVKDAVIISTLYEWQEQIAVGLSYDVNVSSLSKASHIRGGLELTFRYTSPNGFLWQKMK